MLTPFKYQMSHTDTYLNIIIPSKFSGKYIFSSSVIEKTHRLAPQAAVLFVSKKIKP